MRKWFLVLLALGIVLAGWVIANRQALVRTPLASGPDHSPRASRTGRTPAGMIQRAAPPWQAPVTPPEDGRSLDRSPTGPAGGADSAVAGGRDAIPQEFVVTFHNWRESDAFVRRARELGIEILDRMALGNAVRIRASDAAVLRDLRSKSPAATFSPNYYVRSPPVPPSGDKRAPESGYMAFGQNLLNWLGVGENEAWGKGVTVAVLDTPVGRHEALPESLVTRLGEAGASSGSEGTGIDHGTAVASLIVGQAEGLTGIAPSANIVSIPVMTADGAGDTFTLSKGIMEAVGVNASIINVSLGTYGDSPLLREAVDYALASGVAVVAAVGNDAVSGVMYPARYDGVVAVGSVDAAGRHLYFSNRGPEIDIAAPGIAVNAATGSDELVLFSGTSASTPLVSGALAAVLSEDEGLSPLDAEAVLAGYTDDYGPPGRDDEYGSGILNMRRVMDRDEAGIYDVAVSPPYVDESAGGPTQFGITVFAQNRGTETIDGLRLEATAGEQREMLSFRDVRVGASVGHMFIMDRARLEQGASLSVIARATIEGVQDVFPYDNERRTILSLAEAPKP